MLRASARPLAGILSDRASTSEHASTAEQFDQVVATYEKRVYNIAFRMLDNHDDAADVTQEAFIKAYRAFGSFRGESSLFTWLYRIVVNCCKNRLKDRERAGRVGLDSLEILRDGESSEELEIPDWRFSPGRVVERQELRDVVQHAIHSLPTDYRTVIILRDIQGLSYKEISDVVGVPLETIKTRIFRGRAMLRDRLSEYVLS